MAVTRQTLWNRRNSLENLQTLAGDALRISYDDPAGGRFEGGFIVDSPEGLLLFKGHRYEVARAFVLGYMAARRQKGIV